MNTVVDISAQFGGRDAAHDLLPHFWSLKAAADGILFSGFPYPMVALVLRVDGEVSSYGISGASNIDFDSKGEYVSVDIVVTREDRLGIDAFHPSLAIVRGIESALQLIGREKDERLASADLRELEGALRTLCAGYEQAVLART